MITAKRDERLDEDSVWEPALESARISAIKPSNQSTTNVTPMKIVFVDKPNPSAAGTDQFFIPAAFIPKENAIISQVMPLPVSAPNVAPLTIATDTTVPDSLPGWVVPVAVVVLLLLLTRKG